MQALRPVGASPPRVGVLWAPYKPKSLWGAVAGATDTLWLPALLPEQEWVEFQATRSASINETHIFAGVLAFFEGPIPPYSVRLADPRELVGTLNHIARMREWPSLEAGVLQLVPTLVRQVGLRLTRKALQAALRVLPNSAALRHDALVVSWRMVEMQAPDDRPETLSDLLRLYPPDWAVPLAPERAELVWLIVFAALRLAGHRDEASRFFETTVGPGLRSDRALACLEALIARGEDMRPEEWCLLGEGAGLHVDAAAVETVVLLHPPRLPRLPRRLKKTIRTGGG